jgi:hypothetical protein
MPEWPYHFATFNQQHRSPGVIHGDDLASVFSEFDAALAESNIPIFAPSLASQQREENAVGHEYCRNTHVSAY